MNLAARIRRIMRLADDATARWRYVILRGGVVPVIEGEARRQDELAG
jgi:hypothetical protein